jgi:hypothetical protein
LGLASALGLAGAEPSALRRAATKALSASGVTGTFFLNRWPRDSSTNASILGMATDSLGAAPRSRPCVGALRSAGSAGLAGAVVPLTAGFAGACCAGVMAAGPEEEWPNANHAPAAATTPAPASAAIFLREGPVLAARWPRNGWPAGGWNPGGGEDGGGGGVEPCCQRSVTG